MLEEVARKEQQAKRAVAEWQKLGNPWPPVLARPDLLARNGLPVRNADRFAEAGLGEGVVAVRRGGEQEKGGGGVLHGEGVVVVLYVHKRAEYLIVALDALSRVEGINETLLIVSHDGFFPAVDSLVRSITFCRVKQIYFPFSLHLQNGSFPNCSPLDCPPDSRPQGRKKHGLKEGQGMGQKKGQKKGQDTGEDEGQEEKKACFGDVDQSGRYRDPHFVALKHHWWWLQNTVWDGLPETESFTGHMLFIEEDHLLFPNALSHLQALIRVKNRRCSECVGVTLAPSNVRSRGESGLRAFVRERMGNVGYAFNRTVWEQIHQTHKYFCHFDDYNWDVSLSESIFHFWRHSSALRWSAASAHHFGRCGLHSEKADPPAHYLVRKNGTGPGRGSEGSGMEMLAAGDGQRIELYRRRGGDFAAVNVTANASSAVDQCSQEGLQLPRLLPRDLHPDIDVDAPIRAFDFSGPVLKRFTGFGGWGDGRDHMLCMHIGALYGQDAQKHAA
ncbi:hypothetical protein CLOM_g17590 [Closterium sp. NIES-68]|nr:hypothetical protein CLOM_g17590 [Closterium sp. NIES-68]